MAADIESVQDRTDAPRTVKSILKARQQVANHVSAGSDPFVDTNKSVPNPSGGAARLVPDVHLTRFAATPTRAAPDSSDGAAEKPHRPHACTGGTGGLIKLV